MEVASELTKILSDWKSQIFYMQMDVIWPHRTLITASLWTVPWENKFSATQIQVHLRDVRGTKMLNQAIWIHPWMVCVSDDIQGYLNTQSSTGHWTLKVLFTDETMVANNARDVNEKLWDQQSHFVEARNSVPQWPKGHPSRRVGCHASTDNN